MPSNLKPTTARSGVFISYARSDGEKFANDLRQRLETEEIPLWQDRVGMEGGRDWWLQITAALDQVEFMALVITPNALTIVSGAADGTVKVWDGNTGECISTLHVDGRLNSCACSADGEIIAAAGDRGIHSLRLVR